MWTIKKTVYELRMFFVFISFLSLYKHAAAASSYRHYMFFFHNLMRATCKHGACVRWWWRGCVAEENVFFFAVLVHSSALPPAARVCCLLLYDARDRAASLPVLHIIIISSTSCHQIWLRSRARKTKTTNVAVEEHRSEYKSRASFVLHMNLRTYFCALYGRWIMDECVFVYVCNK